MTRGFELWPVDVGQSLGHKAATCRPGTASKATNKRVWKIYAWRRLRSHPAYKRSDSTAGTMLSLGPSAQQQTPAPHLPQQTTASPQHPQIWTVPDCSTSFVDARSFREY
ncbi:hypothetical protein BV22DRAFT_1035345 [Leucogyrophana mollusca]|uniref:Uncharacterized protein n=1 Tax=Leucogyrophana mollusca TaxID=85980 RepID=A0ACB8BG52_9AGAM|nr:hypothetical protein BV22DRAFT_1035345 [Leucogyrophana mollusca]